jgi:hypothetical protein
MFVSIFGMFSVILVMFLYIKQSHKTLNTNYVLNRYIPNRWKRLMETRTYANIELLKKLNAAYPETEGMTYKGLVEWAIRKLIAEKEAS